jgi:hypothetical protein
MGRITLAFDILSCGELIPERDTGVLVSDIDCGGAFDYGVGVLDRGTLDMNGHVIKGVYGAAVVACLGRHCTVRGPGEIADSSSDGVSLTGLATLTIGDVDIHGVRTGIVGDDVGVPSHTRVIATNVTLTNNLAGMLFVGTLKGDDIVASNNGFGGLTVERRLIATNVTTNGNGVSGVSGPRLHVRVTGLTANGNHDCGMLATSARLQDSTLTGNNGFARGVDLATVRRPRLTNVTCVKSGKIGDPGNNWGVCSGD